MYLRATYQALAPVFVKGTLQGLVHIVFLLDKLLDINQIMPYNARGIAFISCEWILTATELIAVTLRLYSRTFLTRSVGSDDFFITIGFVCLSSLASLKHE